MKLLYDDATHQYSLTHDGGTLEGVGAIMPLPIPSVTQVIRASGFYSNYSQGEAALSAMSRGRHIHKITELYDQSIIGPMDIDGEDSGYLEAYTKFSRENEYQAHFIETKMYHPAFLYAGTVDRIGVVTQVGTQFHVLIDIKTGTPHPSTNLQLAAYWKMAEASGYRVERAFAVYLAPSGTYRIVLLENPDEHMEAFISALKIFRWKSKFMPNMKGY